MNQLMTSADMLERQLSTVKYDKKKIKSWFSNHIESEKRLSEIAKVNLDGKRRSFWHNPTKSAEKRAGSNKSPI